MKKIGIDARLMNETGVGTYIRNLLKYLPKDPDVEYIVYCHSGTNEMSDRISELENKDPIASLQGDKITFRNSPFRWHSVDEQTKFLNQINSDNLDLMHFTYFSYPYFYSRPFVITIHDLTPYFFKTGKASTKNSLTYNIKHFFYKQLIRNAASKSKAIITPTNTIKNQIVKTFSTNQEKIFTTYEGINNEIIDSVENTTLEDKFGDNFFLYVGNFYPHKNVDLLIKAFKEISNERIILVGKKDFFYKKIYELVVKNNLKEKIIFYENASAGDLKFFYKNAKALIFPSFSEGFGLPIIEAIYFDCPVICSDIEVFREIIPNNKYFFNPNKVEALIKIISETKSYDKTIVNFDIFSFSKMASETFAIYKKYLQ
jgi:glycosyltransferase involved in cell wall biosynthesis